MDKHTDTVVTENMGLVHMCAKRFSGRGVEYEDLFQIGCLGLLKAALHFDQDRGFRFSTYAVPMILGEIRGYLRSDGLVKVSRSIKELSQKINCMIQQMSKEKGLIPTVTEIAAALNEPEEKVAQAMSASLSAISLTQDRDGDEHQLDIPVESGEEKITDRLSLWQTLEQLPDQDKKLISLRYYMNKTQQETATLMGCSQVQISRREKKVLLFMRGLL